MNVPEDRRYTEEHEWVLVGEGGTVRMGITDYAQDALGDVVYVELPDVGKEVAQGDPIAEVESTKSVADVYAPVAGVVGAVNEALTSEPELVNSDLRANAASRADWKRPSGSRHKALANQSSRLLISSRV